jgi:hypothetical protein
LGVQVTSAQASRGCSVRPPLRPFLVASNRKQRLDTTLATSAHGSHCIAPATQLQLHFFLDMTVKTPGHTDVSSPYEARFCSMQVEQANHALSELDCAHSACRDVAAIGHPCNWKY